MISKRLDGAAMRLQPDKGSFSSMAADRKGSRAYLILLALYCVAFLLRLPGLDCGGVQMPDEDVGAAAKVLMGQLTLQQYYYPPFLHYFIACFYAAYYLLGRIVGWWSSSSEFRAAYFADKTQFYVLMRLAVTVISATVAPLTYLLAVDQEIRKRYAIVIGAIIAFLPASVFFSHVAKHDNGLGPAFLLVLLMSFRLKVHPDQIGRQVGLAAAAAIAFSFKQSAIFMVLPVLLILGGALLRSNFPVTTTLRAATVTAVLTIVFWIPLNIGILVDLRRFLDAQTLLSQMASRDSSASVTASVWFNLITSVRGGVPLAILLLWTSTPIIAFLAFRQSEIRFKLLVIWSSTAIAILSVLSIAGERQPDWLMLPYAVVMATTVLLVGAHLFSSPGRYAQMSGGTILLTVAAFFIIGTIETLRQAVAEPLGSQISKAIEHLIPLESRIVTSVDLKGFLPMSSKGLEEERARDEDLAKKYSVSLPPMAPEAQVTIESGYTVRNFPWVMGGLEALPPEKIKVVIPFSWPIQPEEWQIQYWLDRGYRVFVVEDFLLTHPVAAYRDFFLSISRRCDRLAAIEPHKPMFFEHSTTIYRCD